MRWIVLALLTPLLAGCWVHVVSPQHGAVASDDFTETVCHIRTDHIDASNRDFQDMLATDHVFYLEPVFERMNCSRT